MKKIIFLIGLVLLSSQCFSSGYLTPLGTGVEIDKYQVLGSGGMVIWLKDDIPQNPDECSQTYRVYIEPELAQFNVMASAVIAAHAQGKTIGMWSSGCDTNYFWGGGVTFPIIRDLWVN